MDEEQEAQYEDMIDEAENRTRKASRLHGDGFTDEAGRMQDAANMCYSEAAKLRNNYNG